MAGTKKKELEIIEFDDNFLSGETGSFSPETDHETRVAIAEKINGLDVTKDEKRFADMYIFSQFDDVSAYNSVFNKNGVKDDKQVAREAKRLLSSSSVRNYLIFIREQALKAVGISDRAEFYMRKIVEELYSTIEQDIFDYLDFNQDTKLISLRDPDTLSKEQRRRVKRLRITQTENSKTKEVKTIVDIELNDKTRQIEMLMKHLKMFTKRGFGEETSEKIDKLLKNAEEAVYEDLKPSGEIGDGTPE